LQPVPKSITAISALALYLTCTAYVHASGVPDRGRDLADAIDLAAVSPCFDGESLADEIEHWLERRVVDSRLRIKVTRTRDSLSFAIALGDKPAQFRDFEDVPADCAGERRMLALSIALAIDAVSPRAPRDTSPHRFAVFVGGLVSTSASDRPALGGGAEFRGKVTPAFWPGIGVVAAVARDQPVRDDVPARFDSSLTAARLETCLVLPASRTLDVAGCAEYLMGASTVAARAVDDATVDRQFWSAVGLAAELHVRLTKAFGIHVGLDGLLAVRPGRVQVLDASGAVAVERDLPRWSAAFRLGPSAYF
jgi:hypothetical protein